MIIILSFLLFFCIVITRSFDSLWLLFSWNVLFSKKWITIRMTRIYLESNCNYFHTRNCVFASQLFIWRVMFGIFLRISEPRRWVGYEVVHLGQILGNNAPEIHHQRMLIPRLVMTASKNIGSRATKLFLAHRLVIIFLSRFSTFCWLFLCRLEPVF